MHFRPKKATTIGAAAIAFAGLTIGLAGPANADYAPSATDIVGIGGETPQFNVDFAADGSFTGLLGYNSANNVNKLVSIDATADSNGRAAYAQGSTSGAPKDLNATVVLRKGTKAVQRTKSTGAGYTALLADTGANRQINFIRAASLPTAAQQATAAANGWGSLHVIQIGTDPLQIVGSNTTHAPAGLSTAELLAIYTGVYTKWNQLPGNEAGSANTILPLLPPNGSSIRSGLLNDLKAANGGVTPTLAANVLTVEQNDPGAITTSSSPDDAIVPFSIGRLNLWNAGYFRDPATPFPGASTNLTPGVKALTATAPDGAAGYDAVNGLYLVFRESDAASTTPWQPGSTKNWVKTLFSDPASPASPYFARSTAAALVQAAGAQPIPGSATPFYKDLGAASAG